MSLNIVSDIHNQSETIKIWQHSRESNQAAVARIVRRLGGNYPARQKMRDGGHGRYIVN